MNCRRWVGGLLLLALALPGWAAISPPTPESALPRPPADTRPLDSRGTANLLAYSKLLGLLRYFHPSDQATQLDWDHFVGTTVDEAEFARDAKELEVIFRRLTAPIAPTVQFFPTGQPPLQVTPPTALGARPTAWRHLGLQTTASRSASRFRSQRVIDSAAPLPDPGAPLIVDLGAGVSAVLPIALYADVNGTLPHQPVPSTVEPEIVSPRSVRIANVLLLNAALTHFYPHADGRRRIAENLSSALQSAAVASDDRRFLDVLRGFVGSLDDGHADVLHASDRSRFRIPLGWSWVEGRLAVTAAVPEIPEVRPGDVVLEVDGVAADRAVAEAEKRVSGAAPAHRRYRALEFLASGQEGQSRGLLVQRGEAPPFRVNVPCNAPAFSLSSARRHSPEKVAELAPGLLYVDLDRITDQDWTAALPRLEHAQGLVFDLRGYPASLSPLRVLGRLMDNPVRTCNAIPLTTRPDQPAEPVTSCRILEPEAPRLKAPAVFLIDERAMSLAESLLQIVAENRLATLVGSPTAGTRGEGDQRDASPRGLPRPLDRNPGPERRRLDFLGRGFSTRGGRAAHSRRNQELARRGVGDRSGVATEPIVP